MTKNFPRIKSVESLAGKKLRVGFANGEFRMYDSRPLLKDEPFKALKDEALFRLARAEVHGYAVIWNDEIDLAESDVWLHGRAEPVVAAERSAAYRPAAPRKGEREEVDAGARGGGRASGQRVQGSTKPR